MTYRISKTVLDRQNLGDFAARAATHAVEMKNWRSHMNRVAEDEAAGVTGIDKHMPLQRPREHELVEAAVNENDEMDYEIVDDGPTPEELLAKRKQELSAEVTVAELAAVRAIIPDGKRRMYGMRANDIASADGKVFLELINPGLLKKAATAIGLSKTVDVQAEVAKRRPEHYNKFISEYAQRMERIAAIERRAAEAHHDIEDLTAENIGGWHTPDFKGI